MKTETLTQLIATLFLLSTISERIVNLVKLRFSGCKKLWGAFGRFGNLRNKARDEALELSRARRLLEINVVVGVGLALLLKADLLEMLRHLPDANFRFGWGDYFDAKNGDRQWVDIFSIPVGCVLTGIFLSMGSKFWHDLLDVVLAIKNFKQERTRSLQTLTGEERFNALPADEQAKAIAGLIKLSGPQWLTEYPNVIGYGSATRFRARRSTGQRVIQFRVREKLDLSEVDQAIPLLLPFGDLLIPTDVIEGPPTGIRWRNPGSHKVPTACGTSVSRVDDRETGTIGLKVYKYVEDRIVPCALSCFHVLFSNCIPSDPAADREITLAPGEGAIFHTPGTAAGVQPHRQLCRELHGVLNSVTDAAVAQLLDPDALKETVAPVVFDYEKHEVDGVSLQFTGAASGANTKLTWRAHQAELINFGTDDEPIMRSMRGLIVLDKSAEPGDSGAAVYTRAGEIVGLLIAANTTKSYVIPIQNILNNLQISLTP